MKKIISILLYIVLASASVWAQTEDLDRSIQDQSKKLESLRKEIDRLNQRIKSSSKDEKATLRQIQRLDKQIAMVTQLKRELQKERALKESQIDLLEETIQTTDEKILALRQRIADRAIRSYKQGSGHELELLLLSGDINQMLRRSKYLSAINRAEQDMMDEFSLLLEVNRKSQVDLSRRLYEVTKNIQEEERTSQQISRKQKQKEQQLRSIKKDRQSMQQQVKSNEEDAKKLQAMIENLEKQKQARLKEIARQRGMTLEQAAGEFAKYRGQLSWPVQGRLVARFGPMRNEKLGTVVNNPGIDIEAPKGRSVKAVFDGIVVAITWIPGYGNTIIVDHGASYYTVYAHIDQIQVGMDDYIVRDQIIANVSDTGSLDGARLHFEVWKGKDKVDPLTWLKK